MNDNDPNLFYKTIEEKKIILGIEKINPIYDDFIEHIIHTVNNKSYKLNNNICRVNRFELPIELKDNEYFIIESWDMVNSFVYGNILEKQYLRYFSESVGVIENRDDVIDDIIGSSLT